MNEDTIIEAFKDLNIDDYVIEDKGSHITFYRKGNENKYASISTKKIDETNYGQTSKEQVKSLIVKIWNL